MDDEEHQIRHGKMLTGRQIAWKIYQHFKVTDLETSVMEFTDLCNLRLRGDNLRGFNTAWDDTLLGMKRIPDEDYLESLYRAQIKESSQFRTIFTQLENDHFLNKVPRSYTNLNKLVVAFLDEETRLKHLDSKQRHMEKKG